MVLNLREILGVPELQISFEYPVDLSRLLDGQFSEVSGSPSAKGYVVNEAGALRLAAHVTAAIKTVCSRCAETFDYRIDDDITAYLSESEDASDDSELYLISNSSLDIDEVLCTEIILKLPQNPLCSDACKGLCQNCGHNLNLGPCGCAKEIDPRLKSLSALLDNNE